MQETRVYPIYADTPMARYEFACGNVIKGEAQTVAHMVKCHLKSCEICRAARIQILQKCSWVSSEILNSHYELHAHIDKHEAEHHSITAITDRNK